MATSAPRERHDHAGPGRARALTLRDEACGHPITAATHGVEPAAHPNQRYDVGSGHFLN